MRTNSTEDTFDVVVVGAGAAGMFCAMQAGKRGRKVLVVERSNKVGQKILISGGGRCNFTNIHAEPNCYLSNNPHFCKSALARYSPQDFVDLIERHGIRYHEKKLGQLFCDDSARQVVEMLVSENRRADVTLETNTEISQIHPAGEGFEFLLNGKKFACNSLVIATGGLSIPKMGATPFGHRLAEQFGLSLVAPRPGLVPLTFDQSFLKEFEGLSGISIDTEVRCDSVCFRENTLITHRGISGPAILQISSFWKEGQPIVVDLVPGKDFRNRLIQARQKNGKSRVEQLLSQEFPKNFARRAVECWVPNKSVAELSGADLNQVADFANRWRLTPSGTEGFKKAEVTVGGVATEELSSKTFESKKIPGLYFIGEVVDVTGWLGGYNFQWAWASGFCAGQVV